jgi:hypothetical protein
MAISQDDIRNHLTSLGDVFIQIAHRGDGSPEIAWGDTFVYCRKTDGTIPKMPFVTIVTKDYEGFDFESQLNRGGLFRLNFEIGREGFEEAFGFSPADCDENRARFDFTAIDCFFPHPVYGKSSWACIINPSDQSRGLVESYLSSAFRFARKRIAI